MVLYLKNVVRPSCDHRATCENSREAATELEKNGEGGHNVLLINQDSGGEKAGLQQATSHSANARMPWGDTTAHQVAEVPGVTLDMPTGSMRQRAVLIANVASPLIHVLCP